MSAPVVYVLSRAPEGAESYVVDVFASFGGASVRAVQLQQEEPGDRWAEAFYDPTAGRARWHGGLTATLDIRRWPVLA